MRPMPKREQSSEYSADGVLRHYRTVYPLLTIDELVQFVHRLYGYSVHYLSGRCSWMGWYKDERSKKCQNR